MDILKNKTYEQKDYYYRYSSTPSYYNTIDQKEIMGVGTRMYQNTSSAAHKVSPSDTLDYLALKYYGNPTYWWVVAWFNNIQDPFIKLSDKYSIVYIPNIGSISFGDERTL